MTAKSLVLIGHRFGRWIVCGAAPSRRGITMWACQCDCGSGRAIERAQLVAGRSKSCGCFSAEMTGSRSLKHGQSGITSTRTYRIWKAMKTRCGNPNQKSFKDYGARGIQVCERWRDSFSDFMADMGECPQGHSIERANNHGNYEPGNCKWANRLEQARNTRSNRRIELNGVSRTLAEWAEVSGINRASLWDRLDRGWPVQKALTQPVVGAP